MPNVAQILKSKLDDPQAAKRIAQAPVITIDAQSSVFEAVKMMAQHQIGALIVTEGNEGKIAGIITERDYARKIVLLDRSSKSTAVGEIMTKQVLHVRMTDTTEDCMALMTEHRMRHLPVIDNGKLVGMVSIGDLVKAIISEQQFTIQQLEHYISGVHI
ncbi:CBS domain-containing protein [Trinickia diaoshuihuensis]|jgi:IMP dehydrogenase|uniref:CBS domain-containing protein n=1 Tax=Trinickia diaoshuihuensis TaxID=2292265 RepID=UPI000E22A464|nr:CBS domain-containing protein [Trinickia diaoshuihuensis]